MSFEKLLHFKKEKGKHYGHIIKRKDPT